MNPILRIRKQLELSQAELGEAIGCKQVNVSLYERGQAVPVDRAKRVIAFAASKGLSLTYEDVYGPAAVPAHA